MEKARFLKCIEMINNASDKAMEILEKTSVCQLRSVDRNSKSLKDPDPLSSTMARISLKYPITINKQLAAKYGIPEDLYLYNSQDTRKHGRAPCKKEAVSYWIDHQEPPSNETKDKIDKYMTITKIKVDTLNKVNWEKISFVTGKTVYDRKRVATNPTEFDIPRELRAAAIAKALGISNYIEYVEIPQYYVELVKRIVSTSALDFYSLPNIIQYILTNLDERMRFLPTVGNYTEEFYMLSHALVQPYYRVRGLGKFTQVGRSKNLTITNICKNLLYERQIKMRTCPINIRKEVQEITIHDFPLINLISESSDNLFVKSINGLLGNLITPMIKIKEVLFYPTPTSLLMTEVTNRAEIRFKRYLGNEKVFFSWDGIKGYFHHNSAYISQISICYCSKDQIVMILCAIALYCKSGFEDTVGRTIKTIETEAYQYWSQNYPSLLSLTHSAFNVAYRKMEKEKNIQGKIGILKIEPALDFIVPEPQRVILDGDSLRTENGQLYCAIPRIRSATALDETVDSTSMNFMKYLAPLKLLERSIRITYATQEETINKILQNRWEPCIPEIVQYLPSRYRPSLSKTIRTRLRQFVAEGAQSNKHLLCLYLFTQTNPDGNAPDRGMFLYAGLHELFLDLSSGILKLTQDGHGILLNNKVILSSHETPKLDEEKYIGLIPNFELTTRSFDKTRYTFKTLKWLNEHHQNIPEGPPKYHGPTGGHGRLGLGQGDPFSPGSPPTFARVNCWQ